MKCKKCKEKAIVSGYCKDHFIRYFEDKAKDTIKKYNLLTKKDKVVVAVSGGKDSLSTLYLLKKFGYDVQGIAIDEGIEGYREKTLKDLKKFSKENKIKVKIISFEKEFDITLDKSIKKIKENPCHVCGVLRRFLLNKSSKGYDIIATGHNLDDEAQAIMMNILKAQTELSARLGPVTGVKENNGFTRRIKPLYLHKEKEVKAYTILKGFQVHFTQCPYAHKSFRGEVQKILNNHEDKNPGAKLNLVNSFLKDLARLKKMHQDGNSANKCDKCGEPCSKTTCNTCTILARLRG